MSNDFQEQDAIRYFLGELSETEQSAVEERFFMDADFSDWLDEVETDLIDSYLRGELDASQNQRFEEKFLVSERRRSRVKAAAALLEKERSVAPAFAETAKPSFWESLRSFLTVPQMAYASLGILLLALISGIVLFFQRPTEIVKIGNENLKIESTKPPSPTISPETVPTRTPFQTPSNTNSQTVEPLKTPSPDTPKKEVPKEVKQDSPVMAQFSLTSSSLRNGGAEPTKINLKAGTERVYLRLKFKTEEEFVKYRIELSDQSGNPVSSQDLKNKNALGIMVSAKKLRKGTYKITLKGEKNAQGLELLDVFDLIVEKK